MSTPNPDRKRRLAAIRGAIASLNRVVSIIDRWDAEMVAWLLMSWARDDGLDYQLVKINQELADLLDSSETIFIMGPLVEIFSRVRHTVATEIEGDIKPFLRDLQLVIEDGSREEGRIHFYEPPVSPEVWIAIRRGVQAVYRHRDMISRLVASLRVEALTLASNQELPLPPTGMMKPIAPLQITDGRGSDEQEEESQLALILRSAPANQRPPEPAIATRILGHLATPQAAAKPPRGPEIADAIGFPDNESMVRQWITALKHLGLVEKPGGTKHGYQITDRGRSLLI